jgi:hypothetical protein
LFLYIKKQFYVLLLILIGFFILEKTNILYLDKTRLIRDFDSKKITKYGSSYILLSKYIAVLTNNIDNKNIFSWLIILQITPFLFTLYFKKKISGHLVKYIFFTMIFISLIITIPYLNNYLSFYCGLYACLRFSNIFESYYTKYIIILLMYLLIKLSIHDYIKNYYVIVNLSLNTLSYILYKC